MVLNIYLHMTVMHISLTSVWHGLAFGGSLAEVTRLLETHYT